MAWFNEEISGLLREYAELTQITGGDVFRARNYEKAARSVRGWADDIGQLDVKALRAIPGVGASIAAKIAEYRETGSIRALDELRAKIPSGVLELTRVPGLGPKRALQLNRDLGVQSVDDLAAAIKAGRLDGLAGFGAKSEERIAAGIEVYRQGRERVLLDVALRTANEMVDALTPISQRCAYAGSLRRWRETIGDIDILAAADDSAPLMAAFSASVTAWLAEALPEYRTGLQADRATFRPSEDLAEPYAMIGVPVICADTDARARWLSGSSLLGFVRLRQGRPSELPTAEEAAEYVFTPTERELVKA